MQFFACFSGSTRERQSFGTAILILYEVDHSLKRGNSINLAITRPTRSMKSAPELGSL